MVLKNDLKNFFNKIEIYELSNGFKVVLYQEKRLPEIAINIMFHVGSKDEKKGEFGYAHLFEHLMFQGSLNSPVDFFKALEKFGARVNGGTTEDRTIYWQVIPKGTLEYSLFLESDRLKNLFPFVTKERLLNQIEVVKNEKRQIVENQPYGIADEAISELLFQENHPYRHPVIGYFEDLEMATIEKMKNFFDKYYVPNNGSIAICGDFEKNQVMEFLEKYFGTINSGKYHPPMEEWIPKIKGTPSLTTSSNVELKRNFYLWPAPSLLSNDSKRLFLISKLLSWGKDSPLQKKLVIENPYCQSVTASFFEGEVCGVFSIIATLRKEDGESKVEEIIFNEIENIKRKGINKDELNFTLRGIEAANLKGLENLGGFGGLSDLLNFYQLYFGSAKYFEKDFTKLLSIKKEEIEETFTSVISTSDFAKLSIVPKKASKNIIFEKPTVKTNFHFCLEKPEMKKIKNGLNIYALKENHIPFTTFLLMFKKGSKYDPKKRLGLASMVSDLLDEGSSKKKNVEVSKEIKKIGGFYDILCDKETITIFISMPSRYEEKGSKILCSMAFHPDFDLNEIERIKKLKIASILRSLKDPQFVGESIFQMLLFGKDSPLGHLTAGKISTIQKINRDDIVSFHNQLLNKDILSLLAVGNFKNSTINLFEKEAEKIKLQNFSKKEIEQSCTVGSPKLYYIKFNGIPSAFVTAFTFSVERTNPIFPSLSIFNLIFGGNFTSRLNKKMREEKGYTYGVKTFFSLEKGVLPWFINLTVEVGKVEEAILDILSELNKITTSLPPSKEEFEEAKMGFMARFFQNFETQNDRVVNYSKLLAYDLPLDYYEKYYKRFGETKLDEVVENSKKIFCKERISFLVVGDINKNSLKRLPFDEVVEINPKEFF